MIKMPFKTVFYHFDFTGDDVPILGIQLLHRGGLRRQLIMELKKTRQVRNRFKEVFKLAVHLEELQIKGDNGRAANFGKSGS